VPTKNAGESVVIIGGGPAGSFSAFELAQRGVPVKVFEEHSKVGIPSHCAGHISIRSLRNLGLYPLPSGIVENEFSAANFYSPDGTKFSVHLNQPVTCAINRSLFDSYLAEKAQIVGAKYYLSSRVKSLALEHGIVKGVIVSQDSLEKQVPANLVIDAEGISSRFIRQAGLATFRSQGLVYAVETEMDNVQDVEEHAVEVFIGKEYAPGFYAWLIPRLDGTAKIGLATKNGNPQVFLDNLMRKHPVASRQLRHAKIIQRVFHSISLGGPVAKSYSTGLLAVGDCASQVKSTTGGGVIFSLICAQFAAIVANEAVKQNNFSNDFLQAYQKYCEKRLGFDANVMLWVRRMVNSVSDVQFNRALRFANRIGLDGALRDIDEIDFQGRTLITMLKKPATYAALMYFLWLYLSANA
jgi:digeranylgeranylglycerophospholipid reductase